MTEPENFEEDLFADLYDDDTPAKPAAVQEAASAPAPAPASVPQQSIETHADPPAQQVPDYGGGDDQMKYEDDEDDDDVDFNLGGDSAGGGGGGGGGGSYAPPSNGVGNMKDEEPTYSTSTAKNPSAKEDGWVACLDLINSQLLCSGLRELVRSVVPWNLELDLLGLRDLEGQERATPDVDHHRLGSLFRAVQQAEDKRTRSQEKPEAKKKQKEVTKKVSWNSSLRSPRYADDNGLPNTMVLKSIISANAVDKLLDAA
ncbi:hypothetical protein LZ30DRAFT_689709 [Colletotrichum cereale]|nr:hypothetical protein LZ30DRAFT_689709 [Colletotrichum cereale]